MFDTDHLANVAKVENVAPTPLHRLAAIGIVIGALVLPGAAATAAPFKRGETIDLQALQDKADARFAGADADSDGELTLEEFGTLKPNRPRGHKQAGKQRHKRWRQRGAEQDGAAQAREGGKRRAGQRDAIAAAMRTEMFALLDTDQDGQLSATEYATRLSREDRKAARQRAMFGVLDTNGDGRLSRDEAPNPVARLSAADADGDGLLTPQERRAHYRSAR